jgi:MYXO-CTERM domain-containing protein
VTLIAWDSNGRYADSAPLTVRFDVVPAPGAIAAIAVACLAGVRRRRS